MSDMLFAAGRADRVRSNFGVLSGRDVELSRNDRGLRQMATGECCLPARREGRRRRLVAGLGARGSSAAGNAGRRRNRVSECAWRSGCFRRHACNGRGCGAAPCRRRSRPAGRRTTSWSHAAPALPRAHPASFLEKCLVARFRRNGSGHRVRLVLPDAFVQVSDIARVHRATHLVRSLPVHRRTVAIRRAMRRKLHPATPIVRGDRISPGVSNAADRERRDQDCSTCCLQWWTSRSNTAVLSGTPSRRIPRCVPVFGAPPRAPGAPGCADATRCPHEAGPAPCAYAAGGTDTVCRSVFVQRCASSRKRPNASLFRSS